VSSSMVCCNGRRRDHADSFPQKLERLECFPPVQIHSSGFSVDPIASETPQNFEINRDQSLVLFALPEKAPTVFRHVRLRQENEVIERYGRSRHKVFSVIEDTGIR
jgi:hypothetical protein